MLYQICNGAVSFADDVVLEHINFEIRNTEKIAVVGRNGCGKTTLLRLILGEVDLAKKDSDEDIFIAKAGNPQIGYLKQIAFDDPSISMEKEVRKVFAPMEKMKQELDDMAKALEENYSEQKVKEFTNRQEYFTSIGGYYYEKEYETMIRKFGFSDEDKKKPLCEFSGGQQTKIAFIKLLLSKPDILLLDEPTNHLDVSTIEWLESYIKNYPKAVVVVSHDRMFLDHVVDVVYEIEHHTAKRYPGNYTNFVKVKRENYEKQKKDYLAQQKEIARLQALVERFKNKPTKVAMTRSKLKAIEHMVKVEAPEEYDTKAFHAHFQPLVETGKDVLLVQDLAIGYEKVLSTVGIDLKKGDKIGILGGNGLGKSTFLKTIVGQIPPLGGTYQYGTNIQIGYFDQQMAMYTSNKTVLDDFWDEFPELTQTEARNMLGAFLFSGDDVFKNVNMLSGGEKVRLALCKLLKRIPNVLILDEPTNHMDIVGKETLESMLKEFNGTLIFVSHDRYFVKQIANRLLVFENGTTKEYPDGYEQYKEELEKREESKEQTGVTGKPALTNDGNLSEQGKKKSYYNPGKEQAKRERKLKKIEEKLKQEEEQMENLKMEMMNPDYQSDYVKLNELQEQINQLESDILEDMEEWDRISSEADSTSENLETDVYLHCPVYEREQVKMRFVEMEDARELLACYSDERAVRFFNSDNCHGDDFHYTTMSRMKAAITFWCESYDNRYFVRWTVVEKKTNAVIGTVEMFQSEDQENGEACGILRIDLASNYEKKPYLREILSIAVDNFYLNFKVSHILTKTFPDALERTECLDEAGFLPLGKLFRGEYEGYYIR